MSVLGLRGRNGLTGLTGRTCITSPTAQSKHAKKFPFIIVIGNDGEFYIILAATYFPGRLPLEYRRREWVSLPCSGWERVGHHCYDHQKSVTVRAVAMLHSVTAKQRTQ